MPRHTLAHVSTIALTIVAAASSAALAQVAPPDLVIEGPIDDITADTITVMGIVIKVPPGAVSTPTKTGLSLSDLMITDMPGRSRTEKRPSFIGGTAIVTGGSNMIGDEGVTATEVFTDMNENVIVGEVTSEKGQPLTVNGLPAVPIPASNRVMPATKPMNIFGFEIEPNSVERGSLISIEGYLGTDRTLYYHALEADTGTPKYAGANEVGITRAQCRDRADNNKDELQIQGAVHLANMAALTTANRGAVQITFPAINPRTRAKITGTASATPVLDPTTPSYGTYRINLSNANLDGCPLKVTVSWKGDTDTQLATTDADTEAR